MSVSLRLITKNSSILFLGNLASAFLTFIQGIFIARALGPDSYGFFGVVITVATVFRSFLSFRTEEALTKYIVQYRKEKNYLVNNLILTNILLEIGSAVLVSSLIFLFLPLISKLTPHFYQNSMMYFLYTFVGLFSSLDIVWSCLVRDQRKYLLLVQAPFLINLIQTLLLLCAYFIYKLDVYIIFYLYLCISFLKFSFNTYYIYRYLKINARSTESKIIFDRSTVIKEFWKFTRSTYTASCFSSIAKNVDIIFLSSFRDEASVGCYRLAKNLASVLQMLVSSLITASYRDFVDSFDKKINELRLPLFEISGLIALFVSPFILILTIFSTDFILYFYGLNYNKSIIPFNIMLIGNAFVLIFFWVQPLVLAKGMHNCYRNVVVYGSAILTLVSLVFIYYLGIVGAALSNAAGIFLFTISFLVYLTKKMKKLI